jgi:hypothetical protein
MVLYFPQPQLHACFFFDIDDQVPKTKTKPISYTHLPYKKSIPGSLYMCYGYKILSYLSICFFWIVFWLYYFFLFSLSNMISRSKFAMVAWCGNKRAARGRYVRSLCRLRQRKATLSSLFHSGWFLFKALKTPLKVILLRFLDYFLKKRLARLALSLPKRL